MSGRRVFIEVNPQEFNSILNNIRRLSGNKNFQPVKLSDEDLKFIEDAKKDRKSAKRIKK